MAELLPVQKRPSTRMDKMIAARVMETYTSLFLTPKQEDGSRYSVIARIGDFEVRLLEMPSGNSSEELTLWVELYDRDLRVGEDARHARQHSGPVLHPHAQVIGSLHVADRKDRRLG